MGCPTCIREQQEQRILSIKSKRAEQLLRLIAALKRARTKRALHLSERIMCGSIDVPFSPLSLCCYLYVKLHMRAKESLGVATFAMRKSSKLAQIWRRSKVKLAALEMIIHSQFNGKLTVRHCRRL